MTSSADEIQTLQRLFSAERLDSLFKITGSVEKAVELHQDTLRLGSALMVTIATVEIALRNSVCANLNLHFAVKNWLFQPPVPFQWHRQELDKVTMAHDSARRSEYAKLQQSEKHILESKAYPNGRPAKTTHHARSKARRKHIAVSEGKIIAELTFYFWKRLYGPDYEQSLWRTSLKRTFPCKNTTRAEVAINLENIYQTRNRLAHHEPVVRHRFKVAVQSIEFLIQNLDASKPTINTPLARLLQADLLIAKEQHRSLIAKIDLYKSQKK